MRKLTVLFIAGAFSTMLFEAKASISNVQIDQLGIAEARRNAGGPSWPVTSSYIGMVTFPLERITARCGDLASTCSRSPALVFLHTLAPKDDAGLTFDLWRRLHLQRCTSATLGELEATTPRNSASCSNNLRARDPSTAQLAQRLPRSALSVTPRPFRAFNFGGDVDQE